MSVIRSEGRARRPVSDVRGSMMVLAMLVGAGTGLGSIAFRWCIQTFTRLFSGHDDYAAAPGSSNPHLSWLGPFFVLAVPVVGGLLYGPLVNRFAKEARGHGVPEVMLAVAQRGGRISPKVAVVKTLASALTIGSGGSVGREGPIVQIGSALGSTLGRLTRLTEDRVKLLVACGAAGGIAATFNAPLAGVIFAMELILAAFSIEAFGATVLASVVASIIGRAAFGDVAFLTLPAFHVEHLIQYALFAVLGVLAGGVGVAFTRVLYAIEDACDWVWRGPETAKAPFRAPGIPSLLVVCLAMGGVFGAMEVVTIAFADAQGHRAAAGLVLALQAAGSCAAGLLYGAIRPAGPPEHRLPWCVAAMTALLTLPLLAASLGGSLPLLALTLLIGGMATAPTMVTTMTLVQHRTPEGRLNEGMTLAVTGLLGGIACGSAAGGWTVEHVSPTAAYGIPATAAATALLLTLLPARRTR